MISKLCKPVLSAVLFGLVACASLHSFATTAGPATPIPTYQVGDRWTYQAQEGCRAKQRWVETHEVMAVDPTGIKVRITQKGDGIFNVRMEEWSAPALALGVSGITLADDSSMNPFTGESFAYFNGSQNRGNPNMRAQNPHPQGAVAAGMWQMKDEQQIESKTLPAKRETPITSPSTYAGADYSALLSRLILAAKSVGL